MLSQTVKMFHTKLLVLFILFNTVYLSFGWGFAAEGEEVLKPQLHSGLNGSNLRSQYNKTSRINQREGNFNHDVNQSASGRKLGHGPSESRKEETTERIVAENSREVLEMQHATCKITTEELVATAQATVTRVLKGLCNTKEMEDRFHNLETQLADQLNVIKTMLLNIEDRITEQDQMSRKAQKRILGTIFKQCSSTASLSAPVFNANGKSPLTANLDQDVDTAATWGEEIGSNEVVVSPRHKEMDRYNSTIHIESIPGQPYSRNRVFTYYWHIQGMEYKLTGWNHRRSLRSSSFYISPGGYHMYIRVYPRQNEENVYVHVGLTKGDFDDNLPWPFKLKHRINILDQVSSEDGAQEDISSRVWDPTLLCSGFNWQKPTSGDNYECVGLGFPHSVIRSRHYIHDDAIIIKLSVYLD